MSEMYESGLILKGVHAGLVAMGVDVEKVFPPLGLTVDEVAGSFSGQRRRATVAGYAKFWQLVEEVAQDPDIGLHIGEAVPLNFGLILEYLFLSSSTFGEGLLRAEKYQRLIGDHFVITGNLQEDACYLDSSIMNQRHTNEAMLVHHLRIYKMATDGLFLPTKITFMHDAPADTSEHERILGCPLEFSAPVNRVYFPRELLTAKSPMAQPELVALHMSMADTKLAEVEEEKNVARTQDTIAELLESGEVTLEVVAEKLAIEPSQLRSQLASQGTSFQQLLNEHRSNLAKQLLAKTDEPIDNIVYLLGFVEISSFYRAFKRWVGMTPVQYREQHRVS